MQVTKRPQRFIASHLLSIYPSAAARAAACDRFATALHRTLLPNVSLLAYGASNPQSRSPSDRHVVVFEADPQDVSAIRPNLSVDTVIEPVLPRTPAVASPANIMSAPGTAPPAAKLGTGTTLALTVLGAGNQPVSSAKVTVTYSNLHQPDTYVPALAVTNDAGRVEWSYDPAEWLAQVALVEPASAYWTAVQMMPQTGQTMQLLLLPKTGPIGWWHKLSNVSAFDLAAGKGIKVGVIDTGIGPHPYLDHAVPIGAFLNGNFYPGADQGRDARNHGTHVSGIIGARPPAEGSAFGGIAPGADLLMARVFATDYDGNQGDVANAIDALSGQHAVDVINLSLSGAQSAIEHDAVVLAFQKGTVCICSAGNGFGGAVQYPAAYPESIAVSGLGLVDTAPAGTMPTSFVPTQIDRFGANGVYLASFSNLGSEILCSAPGNGIISTVPATLQTPAPYVEMSGTSMSAPLTAGALTCILSRDADYLRLPRSAARATRAKQLLAQHVMSVNLDPRYQGKGMSRAA